MSENVRMSLGQLTQRLPRFFRLVNYPTKYCDQLDRRTQFGRNYVARRVHMGPQMFWNVLEIEYLFM